MENLLLTGIDTMFLRLHNKLAKELHKLQPKWDSDKIYEETRKLTITLFQVITYLEWLPLLVGPQIFEKFATKFGPYNKHVNNQIRKITSTKMIEYF